jgi:hypothetical protein
MNRTIWVKNPWALIVVTVVTAWSVPEPDEGMAMLSWLKQQDGQSGKVPASVLLFLMDTRPARVNSRNSQYDNPRLVIKPSTV